MQAVVRRRKRLLQHRPYKKNRPEGRHQVTRHLLKPGGEEKWIIVNAA